MEKNSTYASMEKMCHYLGGPFMVLNISNVGLEFEIQKSMVYVWSIDNMKSRQYHGMIFLC